MSKTRGLARRALQAAKRKIIDKLGFVSDQKFYLDSGIVRPRTDVERIMLYSDAVDIEFVLPVDGSKTRNSYRPRYVYALSNATIDPLPGLVYDAKGQFVAESSSWLALRQFYSWPQPNIGVPRLKMAGEFTFLPNNGYYHWLIEDLPVFLKSLAVAPEAKMLLPRGAVSYVREVAELLDNEVFVIESPVRVERLVMTGKTGGMGSPIAGLTPHPADVAMLREFFTKYLTPKSGNRKLYLSRIGQKRSPANEADLQAEVEKYGFEPFDGTGMSLRAQIELFSSATKLIGMHGAGLSNVVWAQEGVDVHEIFSSGYMPSCYSGLTAIRGGSYTPMSYNVDAQNIIDPTSMERLVAIAHDSDKKSG